MEDMTSKQMSAESLMEDKITHTKKRTHADTYTQKTSTV